MSLQSKALADHATVQTSVAETDLLFVEKAGTAAKATRADLLTAATGEDITMTVATGESLRVLGTTDNDALLRVFDDGGCVLNYQEVERVKTTNAGIEFTGAIEVDDEVWNPAIQKGADVTTGLDLVGYALVSAGNFTVAYEEGVTVTRTGTGAYSVIFDTERGSSDYEVDISAHDRSNRNVWDYNHSTTGFDVEIEAATNNSATDSPFKFKVYEQSS